MDPRLIAFVGVAALLTISPGPDMALVLRNSLTRGRSSVFPTAAGTCTGCVIWGAASSVGIAAILDTSAQLYDTLRLAGAAYLAFLGLRTLMDVWVRPSHDAADAGPGAAAATVPGARRSAYRQGLLTNLLNPKVGIFYTTFLPQFIAPGQPALLMSIALASIHAGMNLVWLTAYGRAAVRLGDVLRRGRVRRTIETATGGVLVAFGLGVALERR
jgi:threonine/homoserine/homoserine lactone efflux protein